MASTYYKISHTSPANNSFKYFQLYLYVCSLFSHLLMYLINQLRHLKIYLIKGEKSLSPEVKFFFQAVALWKDEISNEKEEEIPWSSDGLMRKIQRQLIHQARFETKGMAYRHWNNLLPYISFRWVAMFALWWYQKSLHEHKDLVTGNSFIKQFSHMYQPKDCGLK